MSEKKQQAESKGEHLDKMKYIHKKCNGLIEWWQVVEF